MCFGVILQWTLIKQYNRRKKKYLLDSRNKIGCHRLFSSALKCTYFSSPIVCTAIKIILNGCHFLGSISVTHFQAHEGFYWHIYLHWSHSIGIFSGRWTNCYWFNEVDSAKKTTHTHTTGSRTWTEIIAANSWLIFGNMTSLFPREM